MLTVNSSYGHQIIMNNIFLPVSYCLMMETLSNCNWVTISQGCGVSKRTTKEKKNSKKMVAAAI